MLRSYPLLRVGCLQLSSSTHTWFINQTFTLSSCRALKSSNHSHGNWASIHSINMEGKSSKASAEELGQQIQYISAEAAQKIDAQLMSLNRYSLDQLMELAGLAVAQAVYAVHPPEKGNRLLIACGPGNNGGDGLVAARHLKLFNYEPIVYYPKPSAPKGVDASVEGPKKLFKGLQELLDLFEIPIVTEFDSSFERFDFIVDAIFGFSFKGQGEIRDPFKEIIKAMESTSVPVLSVDIPSSWHVQYGQPKEGIGSKFHPPFLISLTAPKPCVATYRGRHFIGGRFVPEDLRKKWGIYNAKYKGSDQIVEVPIPTTDQKSQYPDISPESDLVRAMTDSYQTRWEYIDQLIGKKTQSNAIRNTTQTNSGQIRRNMKRRRW